MFNAKAQQNPQKSILFYATTPGMTFAPAESFSLRNALFDCDAHLRHYLVRAVTSDLFTAERDNGDVPMMASLSELLGNEKEFEGFVRRGFLLLAMKNIATLSGDRG